MGAALFSVLKNVNIVCVYACVYIFMYARCVPVDLAESKGIDKNYAKLLVGLSMSELVYAMCLGVCACMRACVSCEPWRIKGHKSEIRPNCFVIKF